MRVTNVMTTWIHWTAVMALGSIGLGEGRMIFVFDPFITVETSHSQRVSTMTQGYALVRA